uniref:Uncharacterized protein n=1 Tax=Chromera velia CCMP2878 TaxID=1169474 RepID=A0A0G4HZP4_9ALVE|eukprot:Cvel_1579.t1-p1 / transcript=Cvel_1579.t1 / gene=Cvel_1579 / organism=Chromera_velia_CCMP2878 / gene_product=hypothetical protein / transcript_product=hypothetical protein / location=Cvel_scaffold56:81366-88917(-) / protein_length=210 / sequence_SO=supercontig / SO=protein_coding / is_pseudo=false
MSHLAKEAGRTEEPTPKDILAQRAAEIEEAALERSTKSRYESALRLMEKSNPWLLPMRGALDVKMGFAHLRGRKANEIGLLRGAVRWWHHKEGHPPPPFEDPSLSYFFTGLKKLADNTVREKERLMREEIDKIIDMWAQKSTLDASWNIAITVLAFFPAKRIGEILGRNREDFVVKRETSTPPFPDRAHEAMLAFREWQREPVRGSCCSS